MNNNNKSTIIGFPTHEHDPDEPKAKSFRPSDMQALARSRPTDHTHNGDSPPRKFRVSDTTTC
ncbi:hypothetical protein E2C01_030439 [Portunus trituberculatus]|uniref:Uncharacterized protein n=1 Tax=Portunus trituberculatus TaxID=210409 RepID=A0A5B7EUT0_PORTR|nr:hypothetical protein [Portunus trituberculatus]